MKKAKSFLLVGGLFWIIETVYFIGKYGWHWTAYNNAEHICDVIVSVLWGCAAYHFFATIARRVNEIYKNMKKNN